MDVPTAGRSADEMVVKKAAGKVATSADWSVGSAAAATAAWRAAMTGIEKVVY